MKLTIAYLRFHKVRAALLALAFALTAFLPLTLSSLVRTYSTGLTSRATATPLILGAKGDRYDLVLKSLYFSGPLDSPLSAQEVRLAGADGSLQAIPLHLGFTAGQAPLVGTSLAYLRFRRLTLSAGTLPLRLGDVVLGAKVAERLGIKPGGHLLTDQASLFNIAATYPLRMRVTGVLAETGTPDDDAVFADIKTTWVVAGIGHGHADLASSPADVLTRNGTTFQASPALRHYNEITEENVGSFHFHGTDSSLPVSATIIVPENAKAATLLRGRYSVSETRQLLVPEEVVAELLGTVFEIKRFLDRASWLVYSAAALFTALVVLLSLRLREEEFTVLTRIGCARHTILKLQLQELALLLATGLALALVATAATVALAGGLSTFL